MKKRRLGLASTVAIGLVSLSGIGSVATAGIASATEASHRKLEGYTFTEARVGLRAHSQIGVTALCPAGDVVVGGGGYQVTQGLGEDLYSSYPNGKGTGWIAYFNNENSSPDTGVAVAICAASSSLEKYSVHYGALVNIPAGGEGQGVVTCPSGTVSLGGGATMAGAQIYDAINASAPYGTGGWRAYMGSAGSESTEGRAAVVCSRRPAGWKQVASSYVPNPAGTATTVTAMCPKGTRVLAGGPFNSSAKPTVTVGLTTSLTSLTGWHSVEDNASSASESVDEWAVCATAVAATEVSDLKLKGLTFAEGRVSVPAHGNIGVRASCPAGDRVVGGGGYQVTQGLGEDLNASFPFPAGRAWGAYFNNETSSPDTGVAVAICAAASSMADYSIEGSGEENVPSNGEAQLTVTCPSGTVALGGGGQVSGNETYMAIDASAPYGANGWRVYLGSSGSQSATGDVAVVCAREPAGWTQVVSSYVANPAGTATNVTVNCPKGTNTLGGGPFNSSADPTVTVGLTTPLSGLTGWHSVEDNASRASESVDEWAVCADAVATSG
jgi:hypothetical protein